MNKLLVVFFDDEAAANAGLTALRTLHAAGDITLYATGVLARDADGVISIKKSMDAIAAEAVRDFWAAGVGLDFIEWATQHLQPGKVALVAEIEEEWVIPVDLALEAAGGHVFRRTRTELTESQLDHDIAAFKAEIKALETEASHASGAAKAKLEGKMAAAKAELDGALRSAQQRVDALKLEADAKAEALTA